MTREEGNGKDYKRREEKEEMRGYDRERHNKRIAVEI